MSVLPGLVGSCWAATAPSSDYPSLDRHLRTETLVIGAGIVGLTAALRLAREGRQVMVLEARRVGHQVTGRSTAKITTQHSLIYAHLLETLGEYKARLYAEANRTACDTIRNWVDELGLDCDLEPKDSYAYATDPASRPALEAEVQAAQRLGLPAELAEESPLPFPIQGAVRFRDQAQFNPARYLLGLARAAKQAGAALFEETRAMEVAPGSRWRILTERGNVVEADHVLVATNQPFAAPENYNHRTQPRCHVALAARMAPEDLPDGMFITAHDPVHSLRGGRDGKGALLIALGPKFRTGQDGHVDVRFHELERWVRRHFPIGEVAYRWTNEDMDTADRLPFAGQPKPQEAPGYHIATGFNGWGISNGTAAGLLVADHVLRRENPYASLYDPARPFDKELHKGGSTQSPIRSVDDLLPGSGGVLDAEGEDPIAVWRDLHGALHAFSARCTHKGCTITWNNAEPGWDCPCHGSMFAPHGSVIHAPAVRPLEPRPLPGSKTG